MFDIGRQPGDNDDDEKKKRAVWTTKSRLRLNRTRRPPKRRKDGMIIEDHLVCVRPVRTLDSESSVDRHYWERTKLKEEKKIRKGKLRLANTPSYNK